MKIVVLGDIHGRHWWQDIVDKESDADLYVFLGDYVTTHDDISSEQQCIICEDILSFKEDNPDKVILLRGNHDLDELGYSWAQCSGHDSIVAKWLISQKERFLKDTQWIYIHDDMIFSHAGISTVWMKNNKIESIEEINNIEPCEVFAFQSDRFSDYSGESKIQPCVWIRPGSLYRYMVPGYTQIVGHTPVKNIVNLKEEFTDNFNMPNDLWLCDSKLLEYLVIENSQFLVKKSPGIN